MQTPRPQSLAIVEPTTLIIPNTDPPLSLISFIAGLVSLSTGLIFVLIVTRSLSQQDYGTWGLITSLFVYGVLASEIINFWTVRDVARGKKVGKLSLVSSSSLSSVGPMPGHRFAARRRSRSIDHHHRSRNKSDQTNWSFSILNPPKDRSTVLVLFSGSAHPRG